MIAGVYSFGKVNIAQTAFEEITGRDYVYNLEAAHGRNTKLFKLDASKIDRHVLMRKFSVNLSYMFLADVDNNFYNTRYTFDVSIIMTQYSSLLMSFLFN